MSKLLERHSKIFPPIFLVFWTILLFSSFTISSTGKNNEIPSIIPKSEKRIFLSDPERDKKLLKLTGNDRLTEIIIQENSLIVGSKMELASRCYVYSWLVENLNISAALSRLFGIKYIVTGSSVYEYYGEDGEGLTVDFYAAYRDSGSTVLVGEGIIKMYLLTLSGSFINFIEYHNEDSKHVEVQNCMYIRVNNPAARLITDIVFAISNLERVVIKKLFKLDDTVFHIVNTVMKDPHLYLMLQNPGWSPKESASGIAVRIRDTIISEASPEKASEFGKLIERARKEVGYRSAVPK